jgi:hypothetical protein
MSKKFKNEKLLKKKQCILEKAQFQLTLGTVTAVHVVQTRGHSSHG